MPKSETSMLLRNLNQRLTTIEQILPTLATKADLRAFATKDDLKAYATKDDLKAFATKDDLQNELRRYATKDDLNLMKADLQNELQRYATKDDLNLMKVDLQNELQRYATKDDLREEGERSRRYMKMLVEDMYEMIKRILEGQGRNTEWIEELKARLDSHDAMISSLDLRVMALEHGRQRS
jgi:hypothetical protein